MIVLAHALLGNGQRLGGGAMFGNVPRARTPPVRDGASFIPGLVEQLEATGRVVVVDGQRCDLLGDRYRFRESYGHAPGMLHTW